MFVSPVVVCAWDTGGGGYFRTGIEKVDDAARPRGLASIAGIFAAASPVSAHDDDGG